MPDALHDFTLHLVDLSRYSAFEARKIETLLKELGLDIRAKIAATPDARLNTERIRRLRGLGAQVKAALNGGMANISGIVKEDFVSLGKFDAAWTAEWIAEWSGVAGFDPSLTVSRVEQIMGAMEIEGVAWEEWWSSQADTTWRRFQSQMRLGVMEGETMTELGARVLGKVGIDGGVFGPTKANAMAIARTGFNQMVGDVRRDLYASNPDVVGAIEQISTLDARTTDICREYDGKRWSTPDMEPIGHGLEYGGGVPRHWGALTTGTMITTPDGETPIEEIKVGDLVLTHRGRYRPVTETMRKPNDDGMIRVIDLGADRVLWITDEHPVLTPRRGWVRADSVGVGDELFEHLAEPKPVSALRVDNRSAENDPSGRGVELVPPHVAAGSGAARVTLPVKFDDHPVIPKHEVAHATLDDGLTFKTDTVIGQYFGERLLSFWRILDAASCEGFSVRLFGLRKMTRVVFLHGLRSFRVMAACLFGETPCPMVLATELPGGMEGQYRGPGRLSLGMDLNPVAVTCRVQSGLPDSKITLDGSNGFPVSPVLADDQILNGSAVSEVNHFSPLVVAHIGIVDYPGEVFNIGVDEDESYVANRVIVHNCRSAEAPIVRLPNGKFMAPGGRASSTGPVPGDFTYDKWLHSLDDDQIKGLVGEKQFGLYKSGKLPLNEAFRHQYTRPKRPPWVGKKAA